MKKTIIPILIFLFLTLPVYACEPCLETLNLDETAKKADLIIVGQKIKDGPLSGPEQDRDIYPDIYGPDWIDIRILEILKGEEEKRAIRVNSWDAMCSYGIVINDEKNYVMFLQKKENQYDAVDYGCAEKTILIEDDSDIDDLVARLGSEVSRAKTDEKPTDEKLGEDNLFIYLLILIIILSIVIFLGLKLIKRKKA